jgi:Undecaprenyl-phosphate glucose phosphotransferase
MPFDRDYSASVRAPGVRVRHASFAQHGWGAILPSTNSALIRGMFSVMAALSDSGAILLAALGSGTLYHALFYEAAGMFENHAAVGFVIIALFVPPGLMRKDYDVSNFLSFKGQLTRGFALWNMAFLCLVILAFVSKTSAEVSRGTVILFYFTGWLCVSASRVVVARIALHHARDGGVGARRVFLVGDEREMHRFTEHYEPWRQGMRIVAAAVLRGEETLDDDLALAAASARMLRPDDVYILAPWSQTKLIDAAVNAFLRVPASLHLGPERVLDRFAKARLERFGPIASLNLARKPLSLIDVTMKRVVDITLSLVALVVLAPVLALVALAIKFDSPGPVLFKQRRYGFNQEPFRIYKFRSMSTMDDGRHIVQARAGDARITRVGRFIRRCNLDELPQILNVLRGDMSLVGPRPHALAHDQMFEGDIALYARRHNVRPGITGWAQVNGFRGETSTRDLMRGRVEHDLYYIDNWSLGLDLQILFLTVFSRKAYLNAL